MAFTYRWLAGLARLLACALPFSQGAPKCCVENCYLGGIEVVQRARWPIKPRHHHFLGVFRATGEKRAASRRRPNGLNGACGRDAANAGEMHCTPRDRSQSGAEEDRRSARPRLLHKPVPGYRCLPQPAHAAPGRSAPMSIYAPSRASFDAIRRRRLPMHGRLPSRPWRSSRHQDKHIRMPARQAIWEPGGACAFQRTGEWYRGLPPIHSRTICPARPATGDGRLSRFKISLYGACGDS